MNNTKQSTFMELFKKDVNKYTQKKGMFTYLSWAYAVQELKRACPAARWGVTKAEDGAPFFKTDCGYFVEVWVDVDGVSLSQVHPVLDNRNQPIEKPNAFHINTSLQRCLAKAIALHGLGLYVYAGEDLPSVEKEQPKVESKKTTTVEVKGIPDDKMMDMLKYVAENKELGLRQLVANIEQKYHVTKTQEKEIAKVLKSK